MADSDVADITELEKLDWPEAGLENRQGAWSLLLSSNQEQLLSGLALLLALVHLQQDVLRLDVRVDDLTLPVQVVQPLQHLGGSIPAQPHCREVSPAQFPDHMVASVEQISDLHRSDGSSCSSSSEPSSCTGGGVATTGGGGVNMGGGGVNTGGIGLLAKWGVVICVGADDITGGGPMKMGEGFSGGKGGSGGEGLSGGEGGAVAHGSSCSPVLLPSPPVFLAAGRRVSGSCRDG
ncbi:hypothetical protein F7725_006305 [Dissostichus mawsoni]|uniref:Uncharacterized protein n=1 Tax=Dissostichus mawsoni TaxID=36200 RepID=A0A7J5XUI5_DISMA|nr:hypothetical protein F7725_006305 [Dissostichus mawsoni]